MLTQILLMLDNTVRMCLLILLNLTLTIIIATPELITIHCKITINTVTESIPVPLKVMGNTLAGSLYIRNSSNNSVESLIFIYMVKKTIAILLNSRINRSKCIFRHIIVSILRT